MLPICLSFPISQKQVNGIGTPQKYPLSGCTSHQGPPGQLTLCIIWPWHHKPHCGFDVMAKTLCGEKMMQRTSYSRHLLTSSMQSEESASGVLFSSCTTTSLRPSKLLPLDWNHRQKITIPNPHLIVTLSAGCQNFASTLTIVIALLDLWNRF